MKLMLKFSAFSLLIPAVTLANIINIPADQPTIQAGIDTANDGDTVLVQPGIYIENLNFNGKPIVVGSLFITTGDTGNISQTVIDGDSIGTVVTFNNGEDTTSILSGFTITNGFGTYGGGINCQTSNPTLSNLMIVNNVADSYGGGLNCYRSSPIITDVLISENSSGNLGGGVNCSDSANAIMSHVSIINNTSGSGGGGISMWQSAPVIEDVEISDNLAEGVGGGVVFFSSNPILINCQINGNVANGGEGGGIYSGHRTSPIITYCSFTNNTSTNAGGGINIEDSCNAAISNCLFEGNNSIESSGGGIHIENANPIIENTLVLNNSAAWSGGGIALMDSCFAIIRNVTIQGNSATGSGSGHGGGLDCWGYASPDLFRVVITNNSTELGGGGIYCGEFSSPNLVNVTITNNSSQSSVGGIYCYNNSNPRIVNSILWDNQSSEMYSTGSPILHSNVDGGESAIDGVYEWLEGNINADPIFVDYENGDFNLQEGSPCINVGTSFFIWNSDTLVNLPDSSYNGNAPDIGAFEYGSVSVVDNFASIPNEFRIFQNYPNPFNPVTTISYQIPELLFVNLSIFNINGQLVSTLVNEQVQPGSYSVKWDAKDFSSGIYFYKLVAGNYSETGKALLLK